ncbi:uncharacterized protein METZ01_LOCUS499667, partial [marine metagenome]
RGDLQGQVLRHPGSCVLCQRGHTDPGRRRLSQGQPRRAHLPRGQGHGDRRGLRGDHARPGGTPDGPV